MSAFCQLDVHLSPPFAKEVRGGLWNNTPPIAKRTVYLLVLTNHPLPLFCKRRGRVRSLKKQFGRLRTFIKPKSVIRPPGIYFVTFLAFQVLSPCQRHLVCRFVLDVARYAFDKGDCQSARRQDEITLDSNDRFGLKKKIIVV